MRAELAACITAVYKRVMDGINLCLIELELGSFRVIGK